MPFVRHPGLPGKVFMPVFDPERPRKHPCRDCFSCQSCGDDRCQICRGEIAAEAESADVEPENSLPLNQSV